MHYKVVRASLWIDGKRRVRGDVVEMLEVEAIKFGVGLEPVPYEKPIVRKKRATRRASEV